MNGTTEFLAKSLVAAGVFLAIPAAAAVLLALLSIGISLPHVSSTEARWALGIITFCSSGFFLLAQTIRFVRFPDAAPRSKWLWPAVTGYLLSIIALGTWWLLHTYSLARVGEWRSYGGDELESELLFFPAIALLLPVWAVILSTSLWVRHALNRNV